MTTAFFRLLQGVKQGCALSATLFIMFMEKFIDMMREKDLGIVIDRDTTIACTLFADDNTLLAPTYGQMQELLRIFALFCKKYRVSVNLTKKAANSYMII